MRSSLSPADVAEGRRKKQEAIRRKTDGCPSWGDAPLLPSLIKSTHTEWRIDRKRGEGMGEVWHVRFLSGGVRTFPSHDLREQCQICMVPDCQVTQPIVLYMCHMCFIRVGVHAHTYAHHMTCVWVWGAVIGLNLRHPHRCVHHHSRMLSSTWAAHERCKQLCGDLIANVNCELRRS